MRGSEGQDGRRWLVGAAPLVVVVAAGLFAALGPGGSDDDRVAVAPRPVTSPSPAPPEALREGAPPSPDPYGATDPSRSGPVELRSAAHVMRFGARTFPTYPSSVLVERGPTRARAPRSLRTLRALHAYHEEKFVAAPGFGTSRLMTFEPSEEVTVLHDERRYLVKDIALMGIGGPAQGGMSPASEWRRIQIAARDSASVDLRGIEVSFAGDLSSEEVDAVHELLRGSDVVFVKDERRPEALGALRTRPACAMCHQVQRGQLLGALVYRLEPAVSAELPELTTR